MTAHEYGYRDAKLGVYADRDLEELARGMAWASGPVGRGREYFTRIVEYQRGFRTALAEGSRK